MRVLIIGGGNVGAYLTRELDKAGHVVAVVESDATRARDLAEATDAMVYEGDGTDVDLLKSAAVERVDWVLAVSGIDEVNLVSCQLAATLGARRVLARLNDPANRATFDALEIPVVAVTDLMARVISQEVETPDLSHVPLTGRGRLTVVEIEIPDGFPEHALAELDLPRPSTLVAVVRGDEDFVPAADTKLAAGDFVTAVTSQENEDALRRALTVVEGGS